MQAAVAGMPLLFYDRSGNELEPDAGTWASLFAGNDHATADELIGQIVGSMLIHGGAYAFIEYGADPKSPKARPVGLRILPGAAVEPLVTKDRLVGYDLTSDSGKKFRVPPKQIVPFPLYTPSHDYRGVSPIDVLQMAYTTQRNAHRWLNEFYLKGAVAAGFFSTTEPMLQAEEDRFYAKMRRRQGIKRALDPIVLDRNIKFERAGLTQKDMEFLGTQSLTDDIICMVFRTPPLLIGKTDTSGLSDAGLQAQLLLYWEIGVKPIAQRIAKSITMRLLRSPLHLGEFSDGAYSCEFDTTNVLALQRAHLDRAKAIMELTGEPLLDRNEGRDWIDLEPAEEKPEPEAPPAPPKQEANGAATDRMSAGVATDGARGPFASGIEGDQREHMRARAGARFDSADRTVRQGVRKYFAQQERRVVARLRAAYHPKAASTDMTAALDVDQLLEGNDADRSLIRRTLRKVVARAGQTALEDMGSGRPFRLSDAKVIAWLERRASVFVVGTTETTRVKLRASLLEGNQNGESMGEMVARVREVFSERYTGQGTTIVRTEGLGAYNFGTVTAWEQTGEVEGKEWLATSDDRTRETHAEADGQVVGMDEEFEVGADRMTYPGGGSLPEESVNCRCTVLPIVRRGSARLTATAPRAIKHLFAGSSR